VLGKQII